MMSECTVDANHAHAVIVLVGHDQLKASAQLVGGHIGGDALRALHRSEERV